MKIWSDEEFMQNMVFKPLNIIKDFIKRIISSPNTPIRKTKYRSYNKIDRKRNSFNDNFHSHNSHRVEKIDDLDGYEYSSDGKRLCFINYTTGDVVYRGDALFSNLKNMMLNGN